MKDLVKVENDLGSMFKGAKKEKKKNTLIQ